MLADFVVLNENLFEIAPEKIKRMRTKMVGKTF
jgi:predicted amidohydrolase YtcJ